MNYEILATGSSGNAVIINDSILIDCGVTMKQLRPYAEYLKLVLLTHAHGDHFKPATVRALSRKRPALRWACCPWMVDHLLGAGVNIRCIDVLEPGQAASYDGLAAVMPGKLTHNAPNCCWHIFVDGKMVFYATDTGDLEGVIADGYDLYMVEANHTRAELDARLAEKEFNGLYAYEYLAAQNHLSYEQALDWMIENGGHYIWEIDAEDLIGSKHELADSESALWIKMHKHKEKGAENGGGKEDVQRSDS